MEQYGYNLKKSLQNTIIYYVTIETKFSNVLVVTAHPDDMDFGAGGTIALWTQAGIRVSYCIVTDGNAGAVDPNIDLEQLPLIRQQEQKNAAEILGVKDITFLGYDDGSLVPDINLRRDISRVIRKIRPELILCQSPERNWQRIAASHPDHLAAGEATLSAVYPDARNPFAHRSLLEQEGLEPHTVAEVWVMASPRADKTIDITQTIETKLQALACHKTQLPDEGIHLAKHIKAWNSQLAKQGGLGKDRFAEVFHVVNTA